MNKTDAVPRGGGGRPLAGFRDVERLTSDEEKRLAVEIREGSQDALQRLVESNLAYVVTIALEYRSFGLHLDDLINEGCLGLIEAAKRFDPEREVKFISYATWWIRKSMLGALSRQIRVVHVPWYQSKNHQRIVEAQKRLSESLGRPPTEEELSAAVSLSGRVIERSLRHQRREVSLDEPLSPGGTADLKSVLTDEDGQRAEIDLIRRDTARTIRRLLKGLNRRQQLVLSLRFGMNGCRGLKLREIGEMMGLSRERVRQIEVEALDRLRGQMDGELNCKLGRRR